MKRSIFRRGVVYGLPICFGYLAVSFTFGIAAVNAGLTAGQAFLISATNITSAGQFAGLTGIVANASYLEIAATQLVVNLRYMLMSCALTQKFDEKTPLLHRMIIAFGNTDEIFGTSVSYKGYLPPEYTYGVMSVALPGWAFGTLLGGLVGSILPVWLANAMNVALYGMFIAIIIPPARENKVIFGLVAVSMLMSTIFTLTPGLRSISSGFRIIILTILLAGAAAFFFPVKEREHEG